jgi:hypothetical protein
VGIRERASLFGGSVTVTRREGGGWLVRAELPLAEPAPEPAPAPALPAP